MARRRPTEPTVNPARGAALVVIAVLVGLFLLRNGLDTSEVVRSSPDDRTSVEGDDGGADEGAADEGTDSGTDEGTTDDTVPAARPPAQVPTVVLNGSGVTGAAGRYSEALESAGYQMLPAADADARVESSLVLYAEGFELEAEAVAAAIGAPAVVREPLDPAAPPGPISGASVVVVLGPELANLTPPTPAAGTGTTTTSAA